MAKFTPNGAKTYLEVISKVSPIAITGISAADPAVVTVGAANIAKFNNGDTVTIEGAAGDFDAANGSQVIGTVNVGAGTFVLTGVDTTGATGTTFGTVTPQAGSSWYTILSLSNTDPATITLATGDVVNFVAGDVVKIEDTGTELDGQLFLAGPATGDVVPLLGADLTSLGGPVLNTGRASPVKQWAQICLSNLEITQDPADVIDVSTFCAAESLAGTPSPGNVSIETYQDFTRVGFNEWRRATRDGLPRAFHMILPDKAASGLGAPASKGGDILMPITPNGRTETWAVNEAATFTGDAVLNAEPTYLMKEAA